MKITMQKQQASEDSHNIKAEFAKETSSVIVCGSDNAVEVYKIILKAYEAGKKEQKIVLTR